MISRTGPIRHLAPVDRPSLRCCEGRLRGSISVAQVAVVSILDDAEWFRPAMRSLVRPLGYEALVFAPAEAFLASPRLGDTSCLIVDIQMPGMSGLDLQAELQARRSAIPVIFITAFPEERIRQRAVAAGALGFFRQTA